MKSLKDKSKIDELFSSEAKRIGTPTIASRFVKGDGEVLITVPIKNFKRAVDRNRLKRLIRETLRNREMKGMNGAFIYVGKDIADIGTIERDVRKIFENLKTKTLSKSI